MLRLGSESSIATSACCIESKGWIAFWSVLVFASLAMKDRRRQVLVAVGHSLGNQCLQLERVLAPDTQMAGSTRPRARSGGTHFAYLKFGIRVPSAFIGLPPARRLEPTNEITIPA